MTDVRTWLESIGLCDYAGALAENRIDAEVLPHLTEQDLTDLGLPIGPRRMALVAIRALIEAGAQPHTAERNARPQGAERRQITVLLCDLVDSTALAARLDAEDLRAIMQAYRRAAAAVIERYDGHVAQYLGDGVMSYFGWPVAHEDDAQRAGLAALGIIESVRGLTAGVPLHVRIGIASGPVIVGDTGEDDDASLATGETPNLAARLQGLAGQDQIVIAPSTRRLIGAAFELADLGPHALKGIAEPVHVSRVVDVSPAEGRFEALHAGRLTPFVGRVPELVLLLERWERARHGEGQAALVSGEAGIGKSRLAQMLVERAGVDAAVRVLYQCSPYHANSSLYPVIEHLQRAAQFERADDAAARLDKLEKFLSATREDVPAIAPLFAALLSLDSGGRYPPSPLSPQAQKEATLQALVAHLSALAVTQPAIVIVEDVHWIDPTTQEMLDLLLPAVASQRIMLLITCRPEYHPHWSAMGHLTALPLVRCSVFSHWHRAIPTGDATRCVKGRPFSIAGA